MGRSGSLEALEEQGGAPDVERVVGDTDGNLGQGELDSTTVHQDRQTEGGLFGGAARRWTRRVMVVAELVAAEGR
jgi:hypothetical protein